MAAHLGIGGLKGGGTSGVTLFFVLSGFLITTLLAEEQRLNGAIRLGAFYARRALRLAPALVLLLAVLGAQAALAANGFDRVPYNSIDTPGHYPEEMLAAATYSANWFRASGETLGHLSHTWSLSIEEQFYLIWPLVLILAVPLASRARWLATFTVVLAAAAASIALSFVLYTGPDAINRVYFGTDTRANALLLGCALALWLVAGRRLPTSVVLFGAAIALLIPATSITDYSFVFTWGGTLAALGGLALIAGVAGRATSVPALELRPLLYTGRISYGLYLWHIPIFDELAPRLYNDPFWIRWSIPVALSYAVAAASFHFVEKPFLRLKPHPKARRDPGVASEAA